MTRVASHFAIAGESVFIDRQHHSHHVARNLFWLFVVLVKMIWHVAIVASHSKGCSDESHGGNQLIRGNPFEQLDVLENCLGACGRLAFRTPLPGFVGRLVHSRVDLACQFSRLRYISLPLVQIDQRHICRQMQWIDGNGALEVGHSSIDLTILQVS